MLIKYRDDDPKKKQFTFQNSTLIENFLRDETAVTHQTESEIVEPVILSYFLPRDSHYSFAVTRALYEENGIANCCKLIFHKFSAQPELADDSLLTLIDFLIDLETSDPTGLKGDETELYHLKTALNSVIDLLSFFDESNEFPNSNGTGKIRIDPRNINDLKWIHEKIQSPNDTKYMFFLDILSLIRRYWYVGGGNRVMIKNHTYTYRLLADICSIARWPSTAQNRYRLIHLVKNLKQTT